MDPKAPPKFTSPNKPPEIPTMTQEERDEIFHQIEKMEKKMNENSAHMDVVENMMDENRKDMEKNMDENRKEMEKNMENKMLELKIFMYYVILHALDERLLIRDIKMQCNRENIEEINIESQNHDYSLLQDPHHQGFKLASRNYFIPKIDMRKFDGKDPITCIFQMEQFFDLYQTPSLQKVPIASSYLKNDQFIWYQWFCARNEIFLARLDFEGFIL
jgi:hypothetical protein